MSQIAQRLQALGLPLTPANPTAFDYQPAIRHGKLICVAGQIPKLDKTTLVCTGRLGESVNTVTTYGYDPVTNMHEGKVTLCQIAAA